MSREAEGTGSGKRLREITSILHKHNILAGIPPNKLVAILEDLGPIFIKLGQIMSMQPMLPPEYCHELAKLRAEVAPMPYEQVQKILEEEIGPDWSRYFKAVEREPLGSASIAQVHVASMASGEKVVLKIQRQGIYEAVSSDLELLRKAAKVMKYTPMGHAIDFEMVLDELGNITRQEMDFLVEAENILTFQENNRGVSHVACPNLLREHTTSKVLVMEYIQGIPLDQTQALRAQGYDLKDMAYKLALNYIKQIVEDGFFHGDPHCANILIRDRGIVWIDLGMMGRLQERERSLLVRALSAVADNDVSELKDVVLTLGRYTEKIDQTALSEDLQAMLRQYSSMELASLDVMQVWEQCMAVLNRHKIGIPKGVSMLGRSMATFQGTLRTLHTDFSIDQVLSRYMARYYLRSLWSKKRIFSSLRALRSTMRKTARIPHRLLEAIQGFSNGTAHINLELKMSKDMSSHLERMLNKLVVSIITAALLVGSSLICTTNMHPTVMGIPAIGFGGFVASVVLGGWLLLSILRHRD